MKHLLPHVVDAIFAAVSVVSGIALLYFLENMLSINLFDVFDGCILLAIVVTSESNNMISINNNTTPLYPPHLHHSISAPPLERPLLCCCLLTDPWCLTIKFAFITFVSNSYWSYFLISLKFNGHLCVFSLIPFI